MLSREFGTSITDLDQQALTRIKKKKTEINKTTSESKQNASKRRTIPENIFDILNSPGRALRSS